MLPLGDRKTALAKFAKEFLIICTMSYFFIILNNFTKVELSSVRYCLFNVSSNNFL